METSRRDDFANRICKNRRIKWLNISKNACNTMKALVKY